MSTTKTQTSVKQRNVLDSLLIAYPNLLRKGWRQQIRLALPPMNDADGDMEEFNEFLNGFSLEPDAVAIDTNLRELIFFEVEVHSLMSDDKLKIYGKFAIDLIAFDIVFGLMTVNKHGHINSIDIWKHYLQWLKESRK
jgi:hypothetical protein